MALSYFYTSKHKATSGRNYCCQENEGTNFVEVRPVVLSTEMLYNDRLTRCLFHMI